MRQQKICSRSGQSISQDCLELITFPFHTMPTTWLLRSYKCTFNNRKKYGLQGRSLRGDSIRDGWSTPDSVKEILVRPMSIDLVWYKHLTTTFYLPSTATSKLYVQHRFSVRVVASPIGRQKDGSFRAFLFYLSNDMFASGVQDSDLLSGDDSDYFEVNTVLNLETNLHHFSLFTQKPNLILKLG
jgi:hypothetical protein